MTTTIEAQPDTAAAPPPGTSAAPPRGRRGRILAWAIIVVLVIGVTLVALRVAAQAPSAHSSLDPEGRGQSGTLALAEILRDQGVEVEVTGSREEAAALADADATLVFAHPAALSDDAVEELVAASDDVVILSAAARLLRVFELGQDALGTSGAVTVSCELPQFSRVETIDADRLFTPAPGVIGCFTDDEGHAAVLVDERGPGRLVLVNAPTLFSNAHLADNGNAALALALLGQRDRVVWYVPSIADTDLAQTSPDTLASLTPGWVTPAILLLLLTAAAAALWRGRRFGPLVEETLPVTVRASETMLGRAKLTARAADATHAAEALRTGSLVRLAKRLGLGERVSASDIADAAADRLRLARTSLHDLLRGDLPRNDSELVAYARRLDDLENAVDAAVHTERTTP